MTDTLRKARPGDPLRIPASAYNAFIDAALDLRRRSADLGGRAHAPASHDGLVTVRNDSGMSLPAGAVLGIAGPVIDPGDNLEAFRGFRGFRGGGGFRGLALAGAAPVAGEHEGRFVVLAEPLAPGRLGAAHATGLCAVLVSATADTEALRFADIADGDTTSLHAAPTGAAILWRAPAPAPAPGGEPQWAIVRLGAAAAPGVFPVRLVQVGGADGSTTAPATWIYDVFDALTDVPLAQAVDPVAEPHRHRRPALGRMSPATFGYAHPGTPAPGSAPGSVGGAGLVLGWINETLVVEACE